jgi:hypothetical protein
MLCSVVAGYQHWYVTTTPDSILFWEQVNGFGIFSLYQSKIKSYTENLEIDALCEDKFLTIFVT